LQIKDYYVSIDIIIIDNVCVGIVFTSFIVYAYEGIPEKVRIGLMFNDPQTGQYSAVSSFTVDSKKAFNLGISRKRALRAFLKSLPVMRLL